MASPVYQYIEFCTLPETLWGKLKSGHWDWLGVKPDDRTFVVGSPRRSAISDHVSIETRLGSGESRYSVRETDPLNPVPTLRRLKTEDEARVEYTKLVDAAYSNGGQPQVLKVELLVEGDVAASEFVVRMSSTYR
jgi:hypothetical protein